MTNAARVPSLRLEILARFIYAVGVLIGLRLVQLQIINSGEYALAAERNRTQMIYQTAPRGRIYDRNGVTLATSRPAFTLIYLPPPGHKGQQDLRPLARALAREINEDPESLRETLEAAAHDASAVRLAENLPMKAMFRLSELKTIYPGVDLIIEARRYYPFGHFASHLMGYMGKMTPRDWRELKTRGYRADSRIGRLGLEGIFERDLRGRDGGVRMEVDAQGRLKRVLESMSWEPGSNIHLTIDAAVQKAADDGLRASNTGRGAVVAMDPRNGAILALSSAPDFDPNDLLASNSASGKPAARSFPEFNNAIAGTYPPGSTFKIIVGLTGLENGRLHTDEHIYCPGHFELGDKTFLCWNHKGHKSVSWLAAFANSCDVYFYKMGLKIGGAAIEKYEKAFGLGIKTNIALKGERAGHLFGPQTRAQANRSWYDGDTVNLAIGQGELLVTPIQMAVLTAAVANRGTLWRPHYTDRIVYSGGRPEYKQQPENIGTVVLSNRTWDELHEAMRLVVSSGTGYMSSIAGLEVSGKTGTAENPGQDHAWFVAYAAKAGQVPSIAVAVIVENGGHGASAAAPIARDVIKAAFGMNGPHPKKLTGDPDADQG